tara:strand:+ start:45 stop:161 length:117 start_codon:yes stop_codon:yes gene_type:complete
VKINDIETKLRIIVQRKKVDEAIESIDKAAEDNTSAAK